MELDGESEEEVEEEEEAVAQAAAAQRLTRQRAPQPASRPAVFQKNALTMTERRTDTHERVVAHYE
jgi:hypothetical protein